MSSDQSLPSNSSNNSLDSGHVGPIRINKSRPAKGKPYGYTINLKNKISDCLQEAKNYARNKDDGKAYRTMLLNLLSTLENHKQQISNIDGSVTTLLLPLTYATLDVWKGHLKYLDDFISNRPGNVKIFYVFKLDM